MGEPVDPRLLQSDPDYRALVRRRGRLAWSLTLAAFGLLAGFIVGLSWGASLFGRPLAAGGVVTIGMLAGLGLIGACLVLTGFYLHRCTAEFEPAQKRLRDRLDGA